MEEFGEFKNLVNLFFYSNNFIGEFLMKFGLWVEFNFIDVLMNLFLGLILLDMCKKGMMKKLLIFENKFFGEILVSYVNCLMLIWF